MRIRLIQISRSARLGWIVEKKSILKKDLEYQIIM